MSDERYSFTMARERLEEIVTQVRKKDVSLEQSLDLLEEGIRLANICTELSDQTDLRQALEGPADGEVESETPDGNASDDRAEGASKAHSESVEGSDSLER
ncbi:MAG: exodeoxyribonuclease VII small subunit [Actinobacteria bacterium]|nr:exodeoxyribonuclease VII small subunit [Actinomycetota bacterium]MCL5887324.1 exodeoxyribonuclease VII small subunit [Actinomycetota bacterium]